MPLPEDEAHELLLLGLLRRGPMHGYALNKWITHNWGACTALKKPTAYYLLSKMAHRGWITWDKDSTGHGPQRRVYRLTPTGEVAFWNLLRKNLGTYQPVYFAGDVGLSFLDVLPPDEARFLLQNRQQQVQTRRQALEKAPTHTGTAALALEHQRYHLAAEERWLEHLLEHLTAYLSSEEELHG
ncbi:helix-turn-helix transcriptional regulator [uncultured Thermanaerothrix sp.]|uniref:PadR family transcriptional regulator n=1 Tax=uncultured Thermanaerothrix sp. TaxID=1195149 RepID=UPI00261D0BA1|nr:helix-turn-helix transcriptional regulator [uncultured Thermanaerothrix sp.]